MPFPADLVARWEAATGGLLVEGYGLTETAPVVVGNPMTSARRPGSIGVPFPDVDVRIADPDDLSGLGTGRVTLPYFTTEAIAVIDDSTIAVLTDNNYPFGAGRSGTGGPDETEFVLIRIR